MVGFYQSTFKGYCQGKHLDSNLYCLNHSGFRVMAFFMKEKNLMDVLGNFFLTVNDLVEAP